MLGRPGEDEESWGRPRRKLRKRFSFSSFRRIKWGGFPSVLAIVSVAGERRRKRNTRQIDGRNFSSPRKRPSPSPPFAAREGEAKRARGRKERAAESVMHATRRGAGGGRGI